MFDKNFMPASIVRMAVMCCGVAIFSVAIPSAQAAQAAMPKFVNDICLPSSIDERTDVGEDKLPNALPWTRIEPASFEQIWNMPNLVPRLRDRSAARTADSPEWKRRRISYRI